MGSLPPPAGFIAFTLSGREHQEELLLQTLDVSTTWQQVTVHVKELYQALTALLFVTAFQDLPRVVAPLLTQLPVAPNRKTSKR